MTRWKGFRQALSTNQSPPADAAMVKSEKSGQSGDDGLVLPPGADARTVAEAKANAVALRQGQAKAAHHGLAACDVETGGPQGLEPTRYGDWERAGRCIDF
ncbi:MAG: succinate dehydrogenase assembly factor 4 [Pseudomonadota bacterium]